MPDVSILVTAANAVVEAMNTASFGVPLFAERNWGDWEFQLEELDTLRVDVVPGAFVRTELDTQGDIVYEPQIHIAIRKLFGTFDTETDGNPQLASVDELVLLLEQIHSFFCKTLIGSDGEFIWKECQIVIPCSAKMLRLHNQFLGVIRLTFEAGEEIDE